MLRVLACAKKGIEMSKLTETIEKIGESVETFTADTGRKVANLEQITLDADRKAAGLEDRIERIEARGDRPQMGKEDRSEVKVAIDRYFRKGDKSALQPFQADYDEKVMSVGTDSSGGYTHIPELGPEILAAIGNTVPMFQDVSQIVTDSNEYRTIYTTTAPTAARAAESGTRNATDTPVIARVDITLFDLYAYATVSNELLDSSQFDISRYLQGEIERQFSAAIENEIVNGAGSGSQQALGILTQATTTAGDTDSPERSFTLYQRLALGSDSPISTFSYSGLVQLSQELPVRYRRNAKFYASTGGIQTMRQLVDTTGQPIWKDRSGGISERPQSILGYEVVESSELPAVSAGNMPVIFGDLEQAYIWVTHQRGLRVIRDDVTLPGSTKFYMSIQCGGKPGDTRALKALYVG
jgi:HK97 family phage major capsid protein